MSSSHRGVRSVAQNTEPFCSSLLLARLELSDTKVYVPQIRARLGTAALFCEVVVLKMRNPEQAEAGVVPPSQEAVRDPTPAQRARAGPILSPDDSEASGE